MKTLDNFPAGEVPKTLRELQRLGDEIKAAQYFGSSSVETGRVFSGSSFDVSIPSSGARNVVVEFVPDDLTLGGAFCYQLVAVADTDLPNPSIVSAERQRVGVDNKQKWIVYATIPGTRKYKFYFLVAGTGTFTTNLI